MAINSKNKVPEFSIEQEQNEFAASTEREKIKGSKNLNVPPLRFPEFTDEWTKSTIGDCFELYSGNTPSRLDKKNFSGEINWITSGELKEHYIGETKEHISEEVVKENNLKLIPVGTFVIAIYGLEAEGVRGTGSITMQKSTISQACMAFTPTSMITNEFLYSWYKKHGNAIGIKYAQGTKQQNLCYEIIEKFKIQYPSLKEQEKLNHFISLLDERIATQSRIIDKLQSLMSGICERLSYSDMGENIKLGDILLERIEKTTKNNQYEILSSTVKGIFLQREYFSKDIASEDNIGYKVVRLNDIVLSPQNLWMGNINFNDKFQIGAVSPSYKVFTIAEQFYKPFISAILKTRRALYNYELVSEQGASIVRRNLNMEAFEQLTFKIPSYDRQVQIGNVILTLQHRIDLTKKLYSAMIQQKQWFLQQMFI
jgi:type I restriction enzyme S subunit